MSPQGVSIAMSSEVKVSSILCLICCLTAIATLPLAPIVLFRKG